MIFCLGIPPFRNDFTPFDLLYPVRLSHVSRRFRALAIQTYLIWTTFLVQVPACRLLRLSDLYLERLLPLPFHLVVEVNVPLDG
ncbi:hypothetical protein JAAARDRAFT_629956 [Jaapia argillacea MUCL 33604]|uniref:F-box domain-containing protein n=1 Tax=Jaapia argillacea MUCL 33604 TaxID=933084 RepID=A0A067QAU9_9AGAM|nr:hypothetical protein JAAARDRAFT_629956 [Jaapia argillacea MUCL 33604]